MRRGKKLTCGNYADGKTEECDLDCSIVSKIKTFSSRMVLLYLGH